MTTTKSKPVTPEQINRAEGRIAVAKDRLLAKYPLHASVLGSMPVVCRPDVGTMGVTISGSKVHLLHNPGFVLKLPIPELIAVLIHEVHHVIFNHLLMKRKDYPHRSALIVAQEVTVNEFITEPLPKGCVLLQDWPMLPPGESTDQRYQRLKNVVPVNYIVVLCDNHGGWPADLTPEEEEALKELLANAVNSVDPGDIPEELREALQAWGVSTDARVEEISHGFGKTVNWRVALRRYLGGLLDVQPNYNRPPRRFPHMVGILPAQSRRSNKPKVMAVIDTSGSIDAHSLTLIDNELRTLAKHFTVTVVECDVEIHRVYPYKKLDKLWGRGGTDLRPPLEQAFLAKHKPDVLIYFTDLYGPFPDSKPKTPVIWAVLPGGGTPPLWGKVIQIN